jgi:hypothetical protein
MKLAENIHYTLMFFINEIYLILIVELYAVSLEAALNTQTSLTITIPKHCLLPLVVLVIHTTLLWWS